MMTVLVLNILNNDFDGSIAIVYHFNDDGSDYSDSTSFSNY